MPIPTSRTHEAGQITINREKCNGCGLCVEVCSDSVFELIDGKAVATRRNSLFGCIGCGQCMAVCPEGVIAMLGAIHPFIQSGKAAEKFRKNHGIKFKSKEGLFLIIGYPKVKFRHGIRRTFANIDVN